MSKEKPSAKEKEISVSSDAPEPIINESFELRMAKEKVNHAIWNAARRNEGEGK